MGRYVKLEAGAGYLEGTFGALDTARAASCELEADERIDREFQDYDRSWWTPDAQPPEIGFIAGKIAAAEYICRSYQKASQSVDEPVAAVSLRKRAEEEITASRGRGWLLGKDRSRITPKSSASSMFPTIAAGITIPNKLSSGVRTSGPSPWPLPPQRARSF